MKPKCNLCGSGRAEITYPARLGQKPAGSIYACTNNSHGQYYRLVRCRRCGLHYSWPRPAAAVLEGGYSRLTDELYQQELNGRTMTFKRNLAHLAKYKPSGELLDVGASIGVFLDEAGKRGYSVAGIEPSIWCVRQARKLFGLKLLQGTDRNLAKFGRRFDAVTLWDVLEHVADPLMTLKRCRQALKPGGVLAFSTVDIGSVYARVLGRHWPWLMPMHIYYFDRTTIKKYLGKAGFKLLALKRYHHTISFDYLLYKLKSISRPLYWLGKTMKQTVLLNRNIYLTFGLGDFMEVYAQKL